MPTTTRNRIATFSLCLPVLQIQMKVLVLLAILLFCCLGSCKPSLKQVVVKPALDLEFHSKATISKLPLCGLCISFAGQFINQLLNIVLNAGVVGGCTDLCGILEKKTGSKIAGDVCEVLCVYVGIREFIKIIEKSDLDPIYYCELLEVCTVFDGGDATITSLTVTPPSFPQTSDFQILGAFTTNKGTGTGEIVLNIHTVDGVPLGSSTLILPQPPGNYSVSASGNATPDPDCQQEPCENWFPGKYSVTLAICNGQCGSKHPHSEIYDSKTVNFTVTPHN